MKDSAAESTPPTPSEPHEHHLGLAHDLRTMSRRRALSFFAVGAAAAGVAACAPDTSTGETSSSATASAVAQTTPQETTGPYPGDGSNGPNVLIESGIVRSDIASSFGSYTGTAQGVPTTIRLTLQDLAKGGAAGSGMAVYVWHCNHDGEYSLYSADIADQNYLRGVQVADANGVVNFTSIFPACYDGRWPHIHFEVYDSLAVAVAGDNARLTSQIALPQEACTQVFTYDSAYAESITNLAKTTLATDNVFGDGWTAELATVTGTPATAMAITLTVGVAAKT